ncbi:unnamed protein product [Discosporangium mesarthrocarpum]
MAGGFEALGLGPELIRAVKNDFGYVLPTNVQDEAIPLILGGGDVMVAAETGSGKTAAFVLPLLQIIHDDLRASLQARQESKLDTSAVSPVKSHLEWRINVNDKDALVAIKPDGLSCQCRAPVWSGGRAIYGVSGGAYYYEATVEDKGICRFGWATKAASYNLGTDTWGFGYGGTAKKSHDGRFEPYGEPFGKGTVIGCLLDLDQGEISFTKDGVELGQAFKLGPAQTGPFFPAFSFKNAQASFNFGGRHFQYSLHAPYTGLVSADPRHVVGGGVQEAKDARGSSRMRTPRAIIMEPTRDLAEQVSEHLNGFKRHLASPTVEYTLLVGGTDSKASIRALQHGFDVVVGTPGRIIDMLERGALTTSSVRLLVLDEADKLLEMDNLHAILKVYNKLPKNSAGKLRLQVCLFSATLHSKEINALSQSICDHPTWVDLNGVGSVPDTVHHVVVRVDPTDDSLFRSLTVEAETDGACQGVAGARAALSEKIKRLKPQVLLALIESLNMDQALIFCRTNLDCDLLEKFLVEAGGGQRYTGKTSSGKENKFSCCVVAGMRSMKQRRANLQAFKEGDIRFLICTDVAARGIDIKGLPYVVNMTLPDIPENYIHRVGRVGRQNCLGLAVSLVAAAGHQEKVWYHKCSNRGQGCTNRDDLSAGGCTMWYDEPTLLQLVEKRLGQSIREMGKDLAMPPMLGNSPGVAVYGEAVSAGDIQRFYAGLDQHALKELAGLEFEAQNNWLKMTHGQIWA